ncbi:MAG TPA: phosphoadenylyl-sulfate reductase [Burkholderiaceae bacterium]|nr:phosphoadenylyl-sulfate reductase [Burkholderiaceae bacterium]
MSSPSAASLSTLPASSSSSAIDLYARLTPGFDERLLATIEMLKAAADDHPGSVVQATSLGAEDMVLTDLIARLRLGIAIGTLETGELHAETVALIARVEARYERRLEVYRPRQEKVLHFVRQQGADAMYRSIELRKACCELRKMQPLARMLEGRTAWVTGLRREQSTNRGGVAFVETDTQGRTKVNPLADWSWNDVWHYLAVHHVPYNPLHDSFMPSIGCEPCTRAIAVGEDFRAGRWWWEDEAAKECGLHAQPLATVTA